MILLQISDIKSAMAHLLIRESFDLFYLEQAEAVTFASATWRGRRNDAWYDTEERAQEDMTEWVSWSEMKPFVFSYIKGQKTPSVLKVFLKADAVMAEKLLYPQGVWNQFTEQRPELSLQFRYEKGQLSVVTGIAYPEFVLDQQIAFAWDAAVKQYFHQLGIAFC